MKLIYIPLSILIIVSLLSMTGLGSTNLGPTVVSLTDPADIIYYDTSGAQICNGNGVAIHSNDDGYVTWDGPDPHSSYAIWQNTTGQYWLCYDASNTYPVYYMDVGRTYSTSTIGNNKDKVEFDLGSSLGVIGLVVGLMALAAVVGVRVVGTGVSEESVSAILKGTAFLTLWGIFSVMGLALIAAIPVIGPIGYFVLTCIYTLGIINQIGHPGDD